MMSIDKNQVLNSALKFHHSGDLDKADELYLKVIKHDKNDFNANHLHGCILSAKNRHHDAITFLLIALKIKPTNYEVNNNLGITYKNLKDIQNAEKFKEDDETRKVFDESKNKYENYLYSVKSSLTDLDSILSVVNLIPYPSQYSGMPPLLIYKIGKPHCADSI